MRNLEWLLLIKSNNSEKPCGYPELQNSPDFLRVNSDLISVGDHHGPLVVAQHADPFIVVTRQ